MKRMKKLFLCLIVCCFGLYLTSFLPQTAADTEEVNDANTLANELFTKYYNSGSYKKDTTLNISEEVAEEIKEYFHANVNILERTTYYNNDELWMSNGNGYSGYGSYEGKLTNFSVSRSREKGNETVLSIEGGMEGYYCTLNDFKEGKHNSAHVENKITLNNGWASIGEVLYSQSNDIIEGYRLFTAPLWLSTPESKNYISFSLVTLEEEVLDANAKETGNTTRLVMKLWVSSTDKVKVSTDEKFELGEGDEATTHYLFSQAYIYTNYITNLEGNGTKNDPYLIQNDEDWATFGQNAENGYSYDGEYVKLTSNINANETIFKDNNHAFRGTLDGDNKTINANIAGADHTAVIGYVGKKASDNSVPTVKNVIVDGEVSGTDKTGALVSTHYGVMENCTNKATVTSTANEVGGLVGYLCIGAQIQNSTNSGNVAGKLSVGGISGFTGGNSVVNNCTNTGKVEGENVVGGIIGIASQTLKISNNVNEGQVVGNVEQAGKGIGGIVGLTEKNVNISNCENKGTVTFNNDGYNAGGIVGYIDTNSTTPTVVDACENLGNVTAGRYVAGIVGNNLGGVILNSHNSGEIYATKPTSGNEFYAAGIVGRSYTSLKVKDTFTIRVYTSIESFTLKEIELEGTIINCSNSGKVYANSEYTKQFKIGGIVGYLNQDSKTGILTACYNSGEVIGTAQTGGLIGLAQSTTPAQSSKYCYQLGNTVHDLNNSYATKRYSSSDTICTLVGKTSATAAKLCIDIVSSVADGLCQAFTE